MPKTSTGTGRQAEAAVAKYLQHQGYKILDLNWRTRRCEIDIVTQKERTIYFIEVKYRSSDRQGDGIEFITPSKLKQMTYAAESWVAQNRWEGDWQLLAAGVGGEQFESIELVPLD